MATKTLISAAFFLVLLSATWAFDLNVFQNHIDPECLGSFLSNNNERLSQLPGRSMESFISMVEHIEKNHTEYNIYQVAKLLIKRFGYDGIVFQREGGERIPTEDKPYQLRRKIIDKLISFEDLKVFDEGDLDQRDKCAMFFMLGHLVNDTLWVGIDAPFQDPYLTEEEKSSGQSRPVTKHPREQGVVSLGSDEKHAVALSKVLLGIIASASDGTKSLRDMFPHFNDKQNFQGDRQIEPLFGVTIGDAVAHAVKMKDSKLFGDGGEWNSTVCPFEYRLNEIRHGTTLAVIRGAIDGFLIGSALRKMDNRQPKLSKVLRMYYDPRGIVSDFNTGAFVSYCRRADFQNYDSSVQEASAQAFYHAYVALDSDAARNDVEGDNKVRTALSNLQNLGDIIDLRDGRCNMAGRMDQDQCETFSDVFLLLDASAKDEGAEFQKKVISKLTTRLDVGMGAGSLSVYQTRDRLDRIFYNSTNPVLPACWLSRVENGGGSSQEGNDENIMKELNSTLQEFESVMGDRLHSNSRVVVIFKSSAEQTGEKERIKRAADIVREGHRGTRVIAVGENQEYLQLMATDPGNVISGLTDPSALADKLAEHICKVPSFFRYEQCWNNRNRREEEIKYTGFVTPKSTQYWAMYPRYFLKSRSIDFKLQTETLTGNVKVCFSRTDPNPKEETDQRNCQITQREVTEVKFTMKNPCHRYSVHNCPPAYFSVTGIPLESQRQPCSDANCRRNDQIKFTFSHTGVSCNSCLRLVCSPLAVLLLLLAALYPLSNK